ncbi:MFS transporter [Nocardioides pocheonensis]|uniref:MFS transporter n=1 Tax=Nocardioides pocheonensis TaxID=661485 RepID=A0A3N0GVA5_9ACTN|nr:MFS transporter [Nocardioides pocheonensis]RNM16394.1 MFS transporter [Nocardioides pocheonensis]
MPAPDLERRALQRRTIRTLVGSQSVGALGITIGIATASLLARDLSGSEELAGLAQTTQVLGAAVGSWALARLMGARGRRAGLVTGYLVGASGAGLAVVAGVVGSMSLLLVGACLLGATSSANYAARYAATDLATPLDRGRALSVVVWATTIGAVAGPNLTGPSGQLASWLDIPELTGPFALGALGMVLAAVVVGVRLRPDPLLVARAAALPEPETGPGRPAATNGAPSPRLRRDPVRVILRRQPAIAAAIAGLAAAHAVMISVMVMTPLHMEHGGTDLEVIGIVISIHVLGMYAFAPLVGIAADRLGRVAVLATGGGVLLVSLVLCARSPEGSSPQIFVGLFLLGLGWSLATVSASTMVAELAPLGAVTDVQGAADLTMGLAAALGSAASGVIVGELGFPVLAGFASLFAVGVLVAAVLAGRATASPAASLSG